MREQINALAEKAIQLKNNHSTFGNIANVKIIITKTIENLEGDEETYYTTHYSYGDVEKIASFVGSEFLYTTLKYYINNIIEIVDGAKKEKIEEDVSKYKQLNIGNNGDNIKKLISARSVFSEMSMYEIISDIQSDEEERLIALRNDYPEESNIHGLEAELELERDAIDYCLYAYNLSFYDFMQEFDNYVQQSVSADSDYFSFMDKLKEGKIELVIKK